MPDTAQHLEILTRIARIATLDLELRPMLQRVTDALTETLGWEFVACVSVDWLRDRFVCDALTTRMETAAYVGYSREMGSGVMGEVALTGRAILLDDVRASPHYVDVVPGAVSELCVPVRHGGETVAILNLESPRPAAFRGYLPLMETVAEQVAAAIASARLHDQLTHRARLLEMIGEVGRVATDAAELGPLMERVTAYVYERFPLLLASILLTDPAVAEFTQAAHTGTIHPNALSGNQWPVVMGIVGRALRTGEPQLVTDVHADPEYLVVNDATVAELVVPIRWRDRLLGVLNLEAATAEVFSPENLTVFRTLADQVAGAIRMASINRELEDANEQLREANQRLERLSQLDGLTGIANRRAFDEALAHEWRRCGRGEAPLALVMIDIDCFKDYNDQFGHQRGDQCLRIVSRALREELHRAGDFVARYGGEEFGVLLPGMETPAAAAFAEKLRARVEALAIPQAPHAPQAAVVTISAGVASLVPQRDSAPGALVEAADRALYRAKREGRNRVAAAS